MNSRDKILKKLRDARQPFPDAPPRPARYLPVTSIEDTSPDGMLERFRVELEKLSGELFVVEGDDAARDCVLDLLKSHEAERITSWHFKHIPIPKLYTAIKDEGLIVDYPNIHDAEKRAGAIENLEKAEVGLTGVDAVAATTGTLILSMGEGKGRIPSVLPPVHIAIAELDQFVPRIEDWLAKVRASGDTVLTDSSNILFISGPSRTADIEKQLVLGVHGPKRLQVVVKR